MTLYELLTKLHQYDVDDAANVRVEVEITDTYNWHEITSIVWPRYTPEGQEILTIRVDRGHNESSR